MKTDQIIKIGKSLFRTVADALFLFGLFVLAAPGEPSKTLQGKWFFFALVLSVTFQFLEGRTLITVSRIKKSEKSKF